MLWGVLRSLFSSYSGRQNLPHPGTDRQSQIITRWSEYDADAYDVSYSLKITTFNMLAPCYKRLPSPQLDKGLAEVLRRSSLRESTKDFVWKERARRTVDFFNKELFSADIIALQEFWLEEEYASLFCNEIARNGYTYHTLQRSGVKSDAVALLVKSSTFKVVKIKNIELSRFGDRVALLLWLRHMYDPADSSKYEDIVIANTHLSFPHNEFDRANQMEQMKTLTENIDDFVVVNSLDFAVRIVLGDFNVESFSPVCNHLRRSGYASCLEIVPPMDGNEEVSSSSFVSHRTHRKEDLGVDHIFIRRDEACDSAINTSRKLMQVSSSEVLPVELGCSAWNEGFTISDHRPVSSSIVFSSAAPTE